MTIAGTKILYLAIRCFWLHFKKLNFVFQDKEAISDIVENLARLENNEELNIIQETITEDSQADQQTQVKQSLSGNPFISEANL